MKLTKTQFYVWIFIGFCVTMGIVLGITSHYIESNKEYDRLFKELNGCQECGDVLVKCHNGTYEIVRDDKQEFKTICGETIHIPNIYKKQK